MTPPFLQPEPPPPEPPFGLWTSLGILAVGVALAVYVAVAVWRESDRGAEEEETSADNGADTAEQSTTSTEHPDRDVV